MLSFILVAQRDMPVFGTFFWFLLHLQSPYVKTLWGKKKETNLLCTSSSIHISAQTEPNKKRSKFDANSWTSSHGKPKNWHHCWETDWQAAHLNNQPMPLNMKEEWMKKFSLLPMTSSAINCVPILAQGTSSQSLPPNAYPPHPSNLWVELQVIWEWTLVVSDSRVFGLLHISLHCHPQASILADIQNTCQPTTVNCQPQIHLYQPSNQTTFCNINLQKRCKSTLGKLSCNTPTIHWLHTI